MGIDVFREDENGNAIESVFDPTNIVQRYLPSIGDEQYSLIRFIDWYGNTTFNRIQMPTLIREWSEMMKSHEMREDERKLLQGVLEMAIKVSKEVHTYFKFEGD